MSEIAVLGTGLIYRNPKPHLHAVHAYFPSVVQLTNGELLCSLVLGEAFDAENCHTYVARSTDLGQTWRLEGRIYPGTTDRLTSDATRLTALPDGGAVAFMVRSDRTSHPTRALPTRRISASCPPRRCCSGPGTRATRGASPSRCTPPLVGPSFELCCPIVPLRDGRWFLPTSTWRGWDGDCPNGMKMVAFVSHDGGRELARIPGRDARSGATDHLLGIQDLRDAGWPAAGGRLGLRPGRGGRPAEPLRDQRGRRQ